MKNLYWLNKVKIKEREKKDGNFLNPKKAQR